MHDSLAATFALSLDELPAADRRLYAALAIFREDEPIPTVAIAKLWSALGDRDDEETGELLDDLAARALLVLNRPAAPEPMAAATVTIHDLLRDFMAAELGEAAGSPPTGRSWRPIARRRRLPAPGPPRPTTATCTITWPTTWISSPTTTRLPMPSWPRSSPTRLAARQGAAVRLHLRRLPGRPGPGLVPRPRSGSRPDCSRSGADSLGRLPALHPDPQQRQLAGRELRARIGGPCGRNWPLAGCPCSEHVAAGAGSANAKPTLATALLRVARLSLPEREQAAQAGLAAAQAIADERSRAEALAALAPHLTGEPVTGGAGCGAGHRR